MPHRGSEDRAALSYDARSIVSRKQEDLKLRVPVAGGKPTNRDRVTHYLRLSFRGISLTFRSIVPVLSFLVAGVVALALHEAAHVAVARAVGVRVKRVGINWRGPFIVREPGEPRANLYIAVAGPATNLVLAILFWTAAPLFARINLVLGLSNLLPIQGADGSRALEAMREVKTRARVTAVLK